jgi:dTDP-4-amino-4,6-dideoxygalactose transaminase
LTHRYRELLEDVDGFSLPYTSEQVDVSSCYVMPVTVDEPDLRDPLRGLLAERFGIQTTVLYPPINRFSAYLSDGAAPLPRCERAARSQITLPLYPHLAESDQDRVIEALEEGVATLRPRSAAGAP